MDKGNGLKDEDFKELFKFIGKSISVSTLQSGKEDPVKRALFNQDKWGSKSREFTGR